MLMSLVFTSLIYSAGLVTIQYKQNAELLAKHMSWIYDTAQDLLVDPKDKTRLVSRAAFTDQKAAKLCSHLAILNIDYGALKARAQNQADPSNPAHQAILRSIQAGHEMNWKAGREFCGAQPNKAVEPGQPTVELHTTLANLKTRLAWWQNPPFTKGDQSDEAPLARVKTALGVIQNAITFTQNAKGEYNPGKLNRIWYMGLCWDLGTSAILMGAAEEANDRRRADAHRNPNRCDMAYKEFTSIRRMSKPSFVRAKTEVWSFGPASSPTYSRGFSIA